MYIQQRYKFITHYKIPFYLNICYVLLYYYCMSPSRYYWNHALPEKKEYTRLKVLWVFVLVLVYCIINFKSLILFPVL